MGLFFGQKKLLPGHCKGDPIIRLMQIRDPESSGLSTRQQAVAAVSERDPDQLVARVCGTFWPTHRRPVDPDSNTPSFVVLYGYWNPVCVCIGTVSLGDPQMTVMQESVDRSCRTGVACDQVHVAMCISRPGAYQKGHPRCLSALLGYLVCPGRPSSLLLSNNNSPHYAPSD